MHKFELKPGCWVFVPNDETRRVGFMIKRKIESKWKPPQYYAHLRKGGHVYALKKHLGNDLFIQADIDQFFNKINLSRVTRELKPIFRSYKESRDTAFKSVVPFYDSSEIHYILPFGFVQSAIIASLCLCNSALGKYLNTLECNGFRVSVYMDDIIISTSLSITQAEDVFLELQDKSIRSGFPLNSEKTFSPSDKVTAFNIHLSKDKIELTADRLDDFKNSLIGAASAAEVEGILGYINTISPVQASKVLKTII